MILEPIVWALWGRGILGSLVYAQSFSRLGSRSGRTKETVYWKKKDELDSQSIFETDSRAASYISFALSLCLDCSSWLLLTFRQYGTPRLRPVQQGSRSLEPHLRNPASVSYLCKENVGVGGDGVLRLLPRMVRRLESSGMVHGASAPVQNLP